MAQHQDPRRSPLGRTSQLLLVLIALSMLLLPGLAQYRGIHIISANFENRFLHPLPEWPETAREYAKFPKKFERWYNDHFGLRTTMIKLYVLLKYYLLGAIKVDTVVFGSDGWLFYTTHEPQSDPIASYRGTNIMAKAELEAAASNLAAWDAWCRARGIVFVTLIAPNKSAIYPEHLPKGIAPVPRPNRLQQFLTHMQQYRDVTIVDPTERLQQRKDEYIYFKTDSHWTAVGALYAMQAVRDAVADRLAARQAPWQPFELTDFNKTILPRNGGDLSHMLVMANILDEKEIYLRPLEDRNATAVAQGISRPKAILYGDSFSVYLPPFLSQDYELISPPNNSRLDPSFIEEHQPALVVFEIVERNLYKLADLTRKINFTEGRVTPQPPPWVDINKTP